MCVVQTIRHACSSDGGRSLQLDAACTLCAFPCADNTEERHRRERESPPAPWWLVEDPVGQRQVDIEGLDDGRRSAGRQEGHSSYSSLRNHKLEGAGGQWAVRRGNRHTSPSRDLCVGGPSGQRGLSSPVTTSLPMLGRRRGRVGRWGSGDKSPEWSRLSIPAASPPPSNPAKILNRDHPQDTDTPAQGDPEASTAPVDVEDPPLRVDGRSTASLLDHAQSVTARDFLDLTLY